MRNSSLVKRFCAERYRGLSSTPKLRIRKDGRGAFHVRRSDTVRSRGEHGSENAGMSSEKAGENPARRKPKVS